MWLSVWGTSARNIFYRYIYIYIQCFHFIYCETCDSPMGWLFQPANRHLLSLISPTETHLMLKISPIISCTHCWHHMKLLLMLSSSSTLIGSLARVWKFFSEFALFSQTIFCILWRYYAYTYAHVMKMALVQHTYWICLNSTYPPTTVKTLDYLWDKSERMVICRMVEPTSWIITCLMIDERDALYINTKFTVYKQKE